MPHYILTFILSVSSLTFYSQDYQIVKPTEINSNTVSKRHTVKENAVTKTYLVKDASYYTNFIEALEDKKLYLQGDSTLNAKAISLNWYVRIDKEIEKAEGELKKLEQNEK